MYLSGKEHAVAIGVMAMSSEQIAKEQKGLAIQTFHHLGDALWIMNSNK